MLKVVVIGSGNVAQHLVKVFKNSGEVDLVQAYARNAEKLTHLLPETSITTSPESIIEADVYIIAVSDAAISGVSSLLPFNNRLVVHTSGSAPMEEIDGSNRRGVFYPLQTFSKIKEIDFLTVPLCLESENESDILILEQLAKAISGSVYRVNSEQRKSLHLAAVFVSNFTNHMYSIGNDICSESNLPFDILKPLIQETAAKINTLTPHEAQTGPAVRKDEKTIQRHLDMLHDTNKQTIYTLLTQSIQQENV
jgi:predicted short-subunit dehydrogenase-like oxidoreductase (DUF2520 family)